MSNRAVKRYFIVLLIYILKFLHTRIYILSKIYTRWVKITIRSCKLEHDTRSITHLFNLYPYSQNSCPIYRSMIDTKQLALNNPSIKAPQKPLSTNTRLNHRRNTATPLPISRPPPPRQDRREQSRQSRLPLPSHNPLSRTAELAHSSYLL